MMAALIRPPVGLLLLLPIAACESALPTAALDGGHTFGGGNKVELVAQSDTNSRGGHGFGSGSGVGTIGSGNAITANGGGLTFGGGASYDGGMGYGSGNREEGATTAGYTYGSGNAVSGGWGYGSGGRTDEGGAEASSDPTARSGVLVGSGH